MPLNLYQDINLQNLVDPDKIIISGDLGGSIDTKFYLASTSEDNFIISVQPTNVPPNVVCLLAPEINGVVGDFSARIDIDSLPMWQPFPIWRRIIIPPGFGSADISSMTYKIQSYN